MSMIVKSLVLSAGKYEKQCLPISYLNKGYTITVRDSLQLIFPYHFCSFQRSDDHISSMGSNHGNNMNGGSFLMGKSTTHQTFEVNKGLDCVK